MMKKPRSIPVRSREFREMIVSLKALVNMEVSNEQFQDFVRLTLVQIERALNKNRDSLVQHCITQELMQCCTA